MEEARYVEREPKKQTIIYNTGKQGVKLGVVGAMILSFSTHGSVVWMFINGMFSWLYVIYWIIFYSN